MTLQLPPEDRPPTDITEQDTALLRQLELSTSKRLFEACSGSAQSLLMECQWTIHIADVVWLIIQCPDTVTNWRVLNRIAQLAEPLAQFSPLAKIRVYPPAGKGGPFDMRVNERSEYRDGHQPHQP